MNIDRKMLIAALRDTAEKATATEKVERPNYNRDFSRNYGEPETITEIVDKYDRQWIAGRLLGMADVIEAMTSDAAA